MEANPKKFIMQRFGLSKTLFLHNQIEGLTYFDLIEMLTKYASKRIEELGKEVERLRGLVERAFKMRNFNSGITNVLWEQFKANNNL